MSRITTRLIPCFKWAVGSVSHYDPSRDSLLTVCSPNGNIVDETEATGRVFPAMMARRPNSDEGSPWRIRPRGRKSHNGINGLAHGA
jgi:hypothetical protein